MALAKHVIALATMLPPPPLLLRVVDKFFVEEGVGPLLNTSDGLPKRFSVM